MNESLGPKATWKERSGSHLSPEGRGSHAGSGKLALGGESQDLEAGMGLACLKTDCSTTCPCPTGREIREVNRAISQRVSCGKRSVGHSANVH